MRMRYHVNNQALALHPSISIPVVIIVNKN